MLQMKFSVSVTGKHLGGVVTHHSRKEALETTTTSRCTRRYSIQRIFTSTSYLLLT